MSSKVNARSTLTTQSQAPLKGLVAKVKACWMKCQDDAIEAGELAIAQLAAEPSAKEAAIVFGYLPRVYIERGEYEKAQTLVDMGKALSREKLSAKDHARIIYNQGTIYLNTGRFILAEDIYQQLLKVYMNAEDNQAIGNTYNNLAVLASNLGQLDKSLEYFLSALPLIEANSSQFNLANTLSNMSMVYSGLNDTDTAIKFSQRALATIRKTDARLIEADILYRQSRIYLAHDNTSAAEGALDMAEQVLVGKDAAHRHLRNKIQSAAIMYAKGRLDESQKLYSSSIGQAELINAQYMALQAKSAVAGIYLDKKQYSKAITLLSTLYEDPENASRDELFSGVVEMLISAYVNVEQWQQALLVQSGYLEKLKSQYSQDRELKLAQFSVLSKEQEQALQIAELQQVQSNQLLESKQKTIRYQYHLGLALSVAGLLAVILIVLWYRKQVVVIKEASARALVERKNQMMADISHELRTPIAIIKLQLATLEQNLVESPEDTYSQIHHKLADLNNLIDDVFDLSQADSGDLKLQREEIVIMPFLSQWCDKHKILAESSQLELDVQIDIPPTTLLNADMQRLEQILLNLFSNACRYTSSPGVIKFIAKTSGKNLLLVIEDSAPGLSDEQLKHLFVRLYKGEPQISESGPSFGLGLTICESLVLAHKGSISAVHSDLGGIKVTVNLPLDATID